MLWQPALPTRYLEMNTQDLARRIEQRRDELGDDLLILGHHYQQDDVLDHADLTGDSLKLSQMAAKDGVKIPLSRLARVGSAGGRCRLSLYCACTG